MNNISLKSIKYESIKAIFTSIADADKISRADISANTSLSLVTVGKIADALLSLNIICQVKAIRPQAGRRAGLLSVNEDKFALILDLTSRDFQLAILNLRLCLVDKSAYAYDPSLSYADNLNCFLEDASLIIKRKYDVENCFGVGVALPGPYHIETDSFHSCRMPELSRIPIMKTVSRYFYGMPILIDSQINAAARSNISHVDDYISKNIIYWYIGSGYVCGAYMVKGELVLGKDRHACDFGRLLTCDQKTLEDVLGTCETEESYADVLAGSIFNVIKILNPHTLILEFDNRFNGDGIFPLIREDLLTQYHMTESDIPEMKRACCKFRNSHRGLTMGLREMWLDKFVFGTNQDQPSEVIL